ncbi:MAG: prolipoprotein diacylglyceryl transferase [Bacteroidales bacterium]|nr:prolipoprotein diacylglyceryl transferase [Bacteroidales bacterium]MDY0215412.1 prolipoprotein diacylglyceryl transferase [Bacteroidales bacterium]
MNAFVIWDVNPVLVALGSLEVRWYGALLAGGFFLSYLTLGKIFKKEEISQEFLDKFAFNLVIWTIVGLRLGHVLFYEPAYYFANPLEILMVWQGGLASHGAVIAIISYILYFTHKNKIPVLWLFDRVAAVIPIAAGLVRVGNLMNSEIYGTPTTVPWAFVFVRDDLLPRHPSQIYEALVYLSLFVFFLWYYKKLAGKIPAGRFTGIILAVIFTARFFIEFVKDIQVDFEASMFLNMGQWLSIPFVIIGISLWIYSYQKKEIPSFQEIIKPAKKQK